MYKDQYSKLKVLNLYLKQKNAHSFPSMLWNKSLLPFSRTATKPGKEHLRETDYCTSVKIKTGWYA